MPRSLRRLLPVAIVGAAGLLGCGEGTPTGTTPPPGDLPLLRTTWYMHQADSADLPAKVHERRVGAALEETFVDSAQLTLFANDTYEQRYWTRVNVSGLPDRQDYVVDQGTVVKEGFTYRLTSSLRTREFTLRVPSVGIVASSEQMLFLATDPPITEGSYRVVRP